MWARHPWSGPRTEGASRPLTGEGHGCPRLWALAGGAAHPLGPGHTVWSLPFMVPVRRDPSLSGSIVRTHPSPPWWGLLQNFPEHLKSPLLGQDCWSSRAPPSWAFILQDHPVQSACLVGNGRRTPTLVASSTPPLPNDPSFPAASPGIAAHPSAWELPTACHRRTPVHPRANLQTPWVTAPACPPSCAGLSCMVRLPRERRATCLPSWTPRPRAQGSCPAQSREPPSMET